MRVVRTGAGQSARTRVFLCLSTVLCALPALGLDRDRTLAQVQHTAWTIKDGAPTQLSALAQTSDGYLWIGSWRGLYRFDGMSFVRYEPPRGTTLPSPYIVALMATPDGGLWISFSPSGVAFLKDGQLRLFTKTEELPRSHVFGFARDLDGRIWAGTETGLLVFDGSRWTDVRDTWGFHHRRVWTEYVDRAGTLWVAADDTIVYLRRGSGTFQSTGLKLHHGAPEIAQDRDGRMWMSEFGGPLRLIPGAAPHSGAEDPRVEMEGHILFDRAGSVWIASERIGVARVRFPERVGRRRLHPGDPELEIFAERDGLTETAMCCLLEDREGNLWVGTGKGLDRFRASPFVTVRLPAHRRNSILLAGADGDVWVGSAAAAPLLRIHGEEMTELGPSMEFSSVCRDSEGVVWWGTHGGILRQENNRLRFFPQPSELAYDYVWEVVPDRRNGGLWVRLGDVGVLHFQDGQWSDARQVPGLAGLRPRSTYGDTVGRTWFGHAENQVLALDGSVPRSYSQADGIGIGIVRVIRGTGRDLWFGGDSGLALFEDGRFWTIQTAAGRPFNTVSGIVETRDGGLWLNELNGVVHIFPEDVSRLKKEPGRGVRHQIYDSLDGLPGAPQMAYRSSTAIEASDGRLWFATDNGLAWIDPSRVTRNTVPPPVAILSLATDRARYGPAPAVSLPRETSSLRIEYAALSLSAPQRVRFRYRLEGLDDDWQDAGATREAVYRNLGPNRYRFRVTACNGDGVWNQDGAALDFIIPPAWYQTTWFRLSCVATGLPLLWIIYRLRMAQIAASLNVRFHERLEERTRIARELHDTILQTVQGSKMVADTALDYSGDPARVRRALEQLSTWLGQAIHEGRTALSVLHGAPSERNDLAAAFQRAVEECRMWTSIAASFSIAGDVRDLHPVVSDEVYRIGYEAIRNACVHSKGSRLNVRLAYHEDLTLRVTDDGVGMDPLVAQQGRVAHFGLQGMRERARRIGARFSIATSANSGTVITLAVPGRIVFLRSSGKRPPGPIVTFWKRLQAGSPRPK